MDTELFKHFPENFEPRENQLKLLNQISDALKTDKKFIVINAPTGTGKSFLADTAANASDDISVGFADLVNSYRLWQIDGPDSAEKYGHGGAAMLTVTKNLQDQYTKDFGDLHILKGKSNYVCNYDNEFDVENAPCTLAGGKALKKKCWSCNRCSYYKDRNDSLSNKKGVFNYDVWLSLPEYTRKKEVLICDESSELETILISHFSLEIDYESLEKIFEMKKYPRLESESDSKGFRWLKQLSENVECSIEEYKEVAETKSSSSKKAQSKLKVLSKLDNKIQRVLQNWGANGENSDSVEYIVEKVAADRYNKNVKEGITFVPYRANKLANKLFSTAERVILLSATIIDHKKEMMDLGVDRSDYVYIEAPSAFDPKKSPIYIVDKFPLTYTMIEKNLPKVIELTNRILEKHSNQKGLIHTVSFKITKAIQDSINDSRLLFRETGKTNDILLKEHSDTDEPTVMVSPSMSHGVDLKGKLGEFQVIMKVPYLPLSNKRIKRLSKEDYQWYVNKTLSTIVQMAGRCTRNESDVSKTYIVDGSVVDLLKRNWGKLPKYFKDRIRT
jgi:ATP-dependent DNA helicase DinG